MSKYRYVTCTFILDNGKKTTKFQVLRVSCKLLYNLQLDNYSFS